MENEQNRSTGPQDWVRTVIEQGRYFNKEFAITGYRRADNQGGTDLYPACVIEDRLREAHSRLRTAFPMVNVQRRHVKMPEWDPSDADLPVGYAYADAPERLATTSASIVMVPKIQPKTAELSFGFNGNKLPSLRDRLKDVSFCGIAGNLGYFMTEGLINDKFRWSHNTRYPDFPLPTLLSYLGFHLFRDPDSGDAFGSFPGAHPAAIGKRTDGVVEIIPQLEIDGYCVTLAGQRFVISATNDASSTDKVVLFTPGFRSADASANRDRWQVFAPETPIADRINLFVANEGNGSVPVERVVKVWEGRAPLPSFGSVMSFDRRFFKSLFADTEIPQLIDQEIQIEPMGGTDLGGYSEVMGGFVPAVIGGQHVLCVETTEELKHQLQRCGNALSPIAECGRESRNFHPRVREPAGVFAETSDHVGWILFDGRHELSIGASVADVARMLKLFDDDGLCGEKIQHAVFVDGGSAMKAYHIASDGVNVDLSLLNRVAAGARNGPGNDPDGLNLYALLQLGL